MQCAAEPVVAATNERPIAMCVQIDGVVQGVGFRPFVCRLARQMGISGTVRNAGGAVVIEAAAEPDLLGRFVAALREQAPAAAEIAAIVTTAGKLPASTVAGPFAIVASSDSAEAELGVGPDLATCTDCLAEIRDPYDRRFGYAFTNCTNCGPRLSILEGSPYDRAATTMAGFAMCAACCREYDRLSSCPSAGR